MNTLSASRLRPGRAIAAGLAVLLAGCAAVAPGGSDPGTGLPQRGTGAPAVSPLVTEQRWLGEWFRGTPVVIALTDGGTLAVDVPLVNSFDAGSSSIKPALAAVLDRVATSLRRQPSMVVAIAAPADASGNATLAASRAKKVREHLVSRGVAGTRLTGSGAVAAGGAVQMRIVNLAQPVSQLDDTGLPALTLGTTPMAAPRDADQAAASNAPNSGSRGERGRYAEVWRAMAAMCSGVVPQQPPAMLRNPLLANSAIRPAVTSGVSSNPVSLIGLGRPALG